MLTSREVSVADGQSVEHRVVVAGDSGSVDGGLGAGARATGFTPPAVTLPTGGGSIRSMGEKFAANLVTGKGSLTIPIAVSPGRSGFAPQLTLSYDSGAGNGPSGVG